jgi:hypothetical protein
MLSSMPRAREVRHEPKVGRSWDHTAPIGMGQGSGAEKAAVGRDVEWHGLKAIYEKDIGRPTCKNNVALHGWRRLLLRPFHSRCDMAVRPRNSISISLPGQKLRPTFQQSAAVFPLAAERTLPIDRRCAR